MPHIVYIYPEITIKGGADRVVVEKANYLAEHGYQVTIITESQMGCEPSFPLHSAVKHVDMGLDFHRQYKYGFLKRSYTYWLLMRKYRRRLTSFFLQQKPDIVITTLGRSIEIVGKISANCVKLGETHSVKTNVRSLNLLESRGGLYTMVARFMRWKTLRNVAKLDALVLLTQEDATAWKEAKQTFVIPNSVPFIPEKFSSLTKKQVIMVARYNDAKGYDYMIDAWQKVHERHPDWTLNVYGSGELHDDVIRWIQQRHLSSCIILHEPIDHIIEQYIESSICVMSSRYEAFPMALLEAMACGVPCVAFDCPHGPRHIIRHGEDGLLVEYLNSQALADGICRLIEDEHLRKRLGENARKNIQRFSKDSVMKQWEDLFDNLTRNHR